MKSNQLVTQLYFLVKWTLICTVTGFISGGFIAIYVFCVLQATSIRLHYQWFILGLPFIGLLMTTIYNYTTHGRLLGNNVLISAIKGRRDHVSPWMIPFVIVGTSLTHLCGASIGKEDMAAEIAGDVAFYTSRKLRLKQSESQWLMISAIAAGFAGSFGTPISATFFAMEVVNRGKMRLDGLYPAFITALVTKEVTEFLGVKHSTFHIQVPELTLRVFLIVALLGLIFSLVGYGFQIAIMAIRHVGLRLLKKNAYVSFATGALVSVVALSTHTTEYLGLSTQLQAQAFGDHYLSPWAWLAKLGYSSLSIGGFYRGGATTPLFDVGSSFGAMISHLVHLPQNFVAALGLVGVFAAATNTPVACFTLGIEMFQGDGATFFFIIAIFSFIMSGQFSFFAAQKLPKFSEHNVL